LLRGVRSVHPGRAQPLEDVLDCGRVAVQPAQVALYDGHIRVQQLQFFKRRLGLLDSAELGLAGDDIAQAGRPISIDHPGPSPGFDRLGISILW
jgi:hypothetical protein